ncbi:MAG: hypothetical protein SGARI_002868, partial [Bacillariaceae sp.]
IDDDAFMTTELLKEWEKIEVPGGTAAVLTVNGAYSQLGDAWKGFEDRIKEAGWKPSTKPEHEVGQEVYVTMDMQDESKNLTKVYWFLEE